VNQTEQLVSYLAQTLEIVETSNHPLRAVLLSSLRERQTLFVFDNCEHIIDAAARLAHEILTQCPRIKILATSREPLRVLGDRVIGIAPLPLPEMNGAHDPRVALSSPSAQLLIARAQAALPTFHVTVKNAPALARLCHILEGIPLALELAAARLNVLSASELAARLETQIQFLGGSNHVASNRLAPARQQTLRAMFDWSFSLLDESQQILLARLAVFDTRFTLTAAETVCGYAPLAATEILALVSALLSKSLVDLDPDTDGKTRYRLLKVTRQFALEHLGAEYDTVRAYHLNYYLARIESVARQFQAPDQADAFAQVHLSYGNLRTALESAWALEKNRELARLCIALWHYWWTRGHLTEGRFWLDRALSRSREVAEEERAALLNGTARLAMLQGDYARARPLLEEHLALRRARGAPEGIGEALNSLGALYYHTGDTSAARAPWQEGLTLFRALDHVSYTARALNNLGDMAVTQGDVARGQQLLKESYALLKRVRSPRAESIVLINLGTAALQVNDVPRAHTAFRDSLEIKRAIEDRDGIAWTLEGLAVVAARENDYARALLLTGAAQELRARLGTPAPAFFLPRLQQIQQDAFSELSAVEINARLEQGRAFSLEQTIHLALGTTNL